MRNAGQPREMLESGQASITRFSKIAGYWSGVAAVLRSAQHLRQVAGFLGIFAEQPEIDLVLLV